MNPVRSRLRPPATALRAIGAAVLAAGIAAPVVPAIASAAPAASAVAPIDGLDTVFNFRDIGGLTTTDGRTVRPGVVYRSGDLRGIGPAERARMHDAGITNVVDLRTAAERADDPNALNGEFTEIHADVLAGLNGGDLREPQEVNSAIGMNDVTVGSTEVDEKRFGIAGEAMLFPALPNLGSANRAYAAMVREIIDADGATVVNCTAGKDRTGWGMAVIETIIGVPRDQVYADFLATNEVWGDEVVYDSWLDAAFNSVDRIYGDFDTYVSDGLGLTDDEVEALKATLLS